MSWELSCSIGFASGGVFYMKGRLLDSMYLLFHGSMAFQLIISVMDF